MKITTILERFTNHYVESNSLSGEDAINRGHCFIWAWTVYKMLKRRGHKPVLVFCQRSFGGTHAWVELNGTAFDSEHIQGVTRKALAKSFCGFQTHRELREMSEREFRSHWLSTGRYNWLFGNHSFMTSLGKKMAQIEKTA